MITSEEPPVVELEELLDEQKEADVTRIGGQFALIVVLTVVGLATVAVLAAMLVPMVAEVVRWIVFTNHLVQGS